ncbi:hypothetical protein FKM82_027775, partial [Ascaphus truei]
MASRTKDNFRGYNGIPLEEKPKKRRSSTDTDQNANGREEEEEFMLEEELYEYSQTESEQEEFEEPPPKKPEKPTYQKKPAPAAMNFSDLLRLAEKKQFEPVEIIKPVKKTDERPRTAEELEEIEFLERKSHKSVKKTLDRDPKRNGQIVKVSKSSGDKHSSSKEIHSADRKSKYHEKNPSLSAKPLCTETARSGQNGSLKKTSSDISSRTEKKMSVSHSKVSKVSSNGNVKLTSVKELGAKPSLSSRPEVMGNTNGRLQVSARPSGGSGSSSARPPGGSARPPGSSGSGSARPPGG